MIDTRNWFQIRPIYSYIQKQAENEKFLRYLEIGGTFSLIAIFLILAIMPTITTIFSLMGSIKSKEAFIQKADVKINNLVKAQDNYAQFQEKYSLMEESYPNLPHYFQGATNLATIYRDSSIDISSLNINVNPLNGNNKSLDTYDIDIAGDGQYNSILDMIQKLTNNRRLINPVKISLRQPNNLIEKSQSGSKTVSVSLNSNLYYLPQSANEKK